MNKPEQLPEGKLISERLKDMRMSMRGIAEEAGYSEGRIRQVINGYASAGKGQYIVVRAPDEALAKIAYAVGLTVNDLRSVGRPDAAEVLTQIGEKWIAEQRRPSGMRERIDLGAIRAWAQDPLQGDPPQGILELLTDEALVDEIQLRMARYRMDVTDYTNMVARLSREVIDYEKEGSSGDGGTPTEKSDFRFGGDNQTGTTAERVAELERLLDEARHGAADPTSSDSSISDAG